LLRWRIADTLQERMDAAGGGEGGVDTMSMTPEEPHRHEESPARDPERGSGLVGFAAIKYVAIVAIVIAILVFLALYVIPALTD
jgi:hypothetical protein